MVVILPLLDFILKSPEKMAVRRAVERREQFRQVKAHVRKEDGRLQAYGWSLPGKGPEAKNTQSSGGVPVPVPVYCRPLAETTPNMKIWCAAGVNLQGGYTKDGGLMVGGSVFYSEEPKIPEVRPENEVETLDKELKNCREGALLETKLTSTVWICTTTKDASLVTVIDANNPAELLNGFGVCSSHILCIASVPGASACDYYDTKVDLSLGDEFGGEAVVNSNNGGGDDKEEPTEVIKTTKSTRMEEEELEAAVLGKITLIENDPSVINKKDKYQQSQTEDSSKLDETCTTCGDETKDESKTDENVNNSATPRKTQEIMSSILATMWMGDELGNIYVHSSVANWAQCIHSVKLKDAVISIVHINGRVVVALACGALAIFKRTSEGEWDLGNYYLVQIGLQHQSVRQLAVVGDKVWCGYRNKLHVLEPRDIKVIHTLEAHPRRESPVRQIAWLGDGVWVSIRLDSTLRLYHAHTYQHLQDVDIEPYVSKMLGTGKLGFTFVRITSLLISSNRLWIGTSNGVIISVPLTDCGIAAGAVIPTRTGMPGTGVRVTPVPGTFVPYCTMAHAQLSFHGHRDNVKFFVAVPGSGGMSAASSPSEAMAASVTSDGGPTKASSAMLVISGGEGYVDFRIGDEMEDSVIITNDQGFLETAPSNSPSELSHLIVWQVANS